MLESSARAVAVLRSRAPANVEDRNCAKRALAHRLEIPELLLHVAEVGERARDVGVLGPGDGLGDCERALQCHAPRRKLPELPLHDEGASKCSNGATSDGFKLNVAVTVVESASVTAHWPVPLQPPPVQPSKVELESGEADSVTDVRRWR